MLRPDGPDSTLTDVLCTSNEGWAKQLRGLAALAAAQTPRGGSWDDVAEHLEDAADLVTAACPEYVLPAGFSALWPEGLAGQALAAMNRGERA